MSTSSSQPSFAAMAQAMHAASTRTPEKTEVSQQAEAGASAQGSPRGNRNKKRSQRGKGSAPRRNQQNNNRSGSKRQFTPPVVTLDVAAISYPESLPVSARRNDIMAAIRDHQVVIIAGETGSGKTTQIPKMCLQLGLAETGLIGHTQPRRLAARSVAERIAEELGEKLGQTVGYQVRFTSEVSENSAIKLMTDGILLAEIANDRELRKYSTIIIDEAHERSLNIDFILGYLKRLLPKRPDLKVIITSATIDPERFARHFAPSFVPGKGIVDESLSPEEKEIAEQLVPDDAPPIIEVSGRTFPVEIRYRPLNNPCTGDGGEDAEDAGDGLEDEDRDPIDGILEAVRELSEEEPGDILIFFSGEREIRDAEDALRSLVASSRRFGSYEILPLYARLSMAEQHRVFRPSGKPRIVLATNVAETSLTVPGIKYVIDTGTARISRYSARTKVQRLPIERISQASANQRSGRAGRTSDGIAIRLYSEEDFVSRPEFTDPEILRTNLAAVILQMTAIGVVRSPGDIEKFPFVEPPEKRAINDGVNLLRELGALKDAQKSASRGRRGASSPLTAAGRAMAALPVDPRLARMIVEANQRGCAKEMMVLAAALTIQDPRERPSEKRGEADAMHKRYADETSDFLSFLLLWGFLNEKQEELSSSQLRKMCHREFINFLRVREWQDLFAQLREMGRSAGISVSSGRDIDPAAHEEALHKSLLAGLLSHIGLKDERNPNEYLGARGTRFAIFPGSALFKKRPDWIVSAELVETSRLWARMNADIKPEWVEEVGSHLVKRHYSEPHWSSKLGAVMAYEKVTLHGVPIIADRRVQYWRIDPVLSREMFIRSALVEGDWNTRHHFFKRNQKALAAVEELEARLRRRDLRVDDQILFDFYDARVPAGVVSERHFDKWWKEERTRNEHLLDFSPENLIDEEAADYDESAFPRTWVAQGSGGELVLDLRYEYAPAVAVGGVRSHDAQTDGIAVQVPVLFLNQLEPAPFKWLIPGLREELVTALIKSMPKQQRKNFVPAPDVARQAVALLNEEFSPTESSLEEALALVLRRLRGHVVDPDIFEWDAVPPHLRFTFQVRNPQNKILGEGKDLKELQSRLHTEIRSALAASLGASPDALAAMLSGAPAQPAQGKATGGRASAPSPRMDASCRAGKNQAGSAQSVERSGLTEWPTPDLPRKIERSIATQTVAGYPALVDEGSSVGVRIFPHETEQLRAQRAGVIRLLQLQVPSPVRYVSDHLNNKEKIVFTQNPHGSIDQLITDCTVAAVDKLTPHTPIFEKAEFEQLFNAVRAELIDTVFEVTKLVAEILSEAATVRKLIKKSSSMAVIHAISDIKAQLEHLIYPGFVAKTGYDQLVHLPRYLKAMQIRINKLVGAQINRDNQLMLAVQDLEDAYDTAVKKLPAGTVPSREMERVEWMIEELRVSFFAQDLGTAYTVSEKRIGKALREAVEALNK
ncbi:ATP-dependent RNA helicase HrpA [Rothia sp. ZJ932]|uniref:ATP-dependent RNA helicase HrpA n=1 Tax=Rothia sp. ZJ932 TaxID=2810516 RepID=UPI00196748D2|nr:ATP-dependent RNA helicase HrpA [Rothia sp. ZJ932]QRZ62253.1 ATP-dependent RNA helicase HrpA [Rothia sp. ZJ932]